MNSTYDLIVKTAHKGVSLLDKRGAAPAGHNGPYNDPETPVRNTSHWIVTFSKAYDLTGNDVFRDAIADAVDYLLSEDARPQGYTFHCRNVDGKDSCNGLIGQAWAIEGLVAAANQGIRADRALEVAREVFITHPFHADVALWRTAEPTGEVKRFDLTYNHQLWFAAVGAQLADTGVSKVDQQVKRFIERLERLTDVNSEGLIRHPLRPEFSVSEYISYLDSPASYWLLAPTALHALSVVNSARRDDLYEKAWGYHSFNLHALAMLAEHYPTSSVWNSSILKRTVDIISNIKYQFKIYYNLYGYSYNLAGFENAYALEVFDGEETHHDQQRWIEKQLNACYDPEQNLLTNGTSDPATHAARIYELTYLPDIKIELSVEENCSPIVATTDIQ